jgi:integrase
MAHQEVIMSRRRKRAARKRVGRVSYYLHHGSWYVYYRLGTRPVRVRIGQSEAAAARVAAERNAELAGGQIATAPTFEPLSVADLRHRFLDHHEHVLGSSLATVNRYRTATAYLATFAAQGGRSLPAHLVVADDFLRWLRRVQVAPNGHSSSRRRPLRERGIQFILNTCRTLYQYAGKRRHLPPYAQNPFSELAGRKLREDDAKPIFVFDQRTEHQFLTAADAWSFPIHFMAAKTGLRSGESAHLLLEDLDLQRGWLTVCGKPELGWRVKTRRERNVPLITELVNVLKGVVGVRTAGPLFLRPRFQLEPALLWNCSRERLAAACRDRTSFSEKELGRTLTRQEVARVAAKVWCDSGAIDADDIRRSFIRTATAIGLVGASCPKSWRHTFATLLQDAGVDPLIRQVTMGHTPAGDRKGALAMTAVYTHTRPETQKREIERALRLWSESLRLAERRASIAAERAAMDHID